MYCDLASAYNGFRPVQLVEPATDTEADPPVLHYPQRTVPLQPLHSAEISDRRLLLLLAGLVVVLLFVLLVLVVQLSQAQTALLRALAWR